MSMSVPVPPRATDTEHRQLNQLESREDDDRQGDQCHPARVILPSLENAVAPGLEVKRPVEKPEPEPERTYRFRMMRSNRENQVRLNSGRATQRVRGQDRSPGDGRVGHRVTSTIVDRAHNLEGRGVETEHQREADYKEQKSFHKYFLLNPS